MRLAKTILMTFCILGIASAFSVHAQKAKLKPASARPVATSFSRITQEEISLLLLDLAEVNSTILDGLRDDPELRRAQLDDLKQLLAFAAEAVRVGIVKEPRHQAELENLRLETIAVHYDRHINQSKTGPSFSSITDAEVTAYWGEDRGSKLSPAVKRARAAKFEQFLNTKLSLLKADHPGMDKPISEEERKQARDIFAKIQIYAAEYARRLPVLPLSLRKRTNLRVKLQQAQFLARVLSKRIASEVAASDDEIADYLEEHPEFDSTSQRTKAEEILARAKAGEDFAKLANEFSEDPGNKNQSNEPQGGLYQNVARGVFVPPFEAAALALEPGQIFPDLVESDFGYHIIKLERKSDTYDVRHILIATTVDDPDDPDRGSTPVRQHVRKLIEDEKEKTILDNLIVTNKISVPNDFIVPTSANAETKPAPPRRKAPVRKRS